MPSSSKQQQKFMGMVHALKKGDIKPSDVSQSVKDAAKSMSKKDAKDFASTKHKGLPKKVKQEILNKLKEYANKMGTDHLGGDDYTSKRKGGLRDFDGYDNVDYNKDMPMDEGFKSEYEGNDNIIWKKGKTRGGVTNFTPYYKGHNIDKGGHNFKTEKELKDFIKDYILSNQLYRKYRYESIDEATRGEIHKAAKKGSYPVSLVVSKNGKVINQVNNINTPQEVPAAFLVVKNYHKHKGATVAVEDKTGKILFKESVNEGMFSTIDQIRQDSKDVRDFVKNVFKDRDFKDMKNDKEFLKYLKSIYEGTNESKGVPQNYMQGRTSDYHTALRGKNRKYDDTNFDKENSGQDDLEESFDKLEHLKLLNQALKAIPGSQKQKEIIRQLNKVRKSGGMRPVKESSIVEYGQRLDLSFIEDEESKLKGTPVPKDAIDRNLDEKKNLNELGIFPISNYIKGMIPSKMLNTVNRNNKEKFDAVIDDLIRTLNHFWKKNNIPYRVRKR